MIARNVVITVTKNEKNHDKTTRSKAMDTKTTILTIQEKNTTRRPRGTK